MRELPNTKEYEPYDLSLTLDKRFLFKNGKFAPFTLHDLIQINYSYHYECYSISEVSDEYEISFDVIKRILSRYQKGDFDKFINDEYFKDLNEGELKNHYSRFEDFLKGKSADFTSLTMKGYSIAKSCEISNLDIDEVESWLLKGEKGLKPYDIFYDAFLESKEQLLDEKAPLLIENIESEESPKENIESGRREGLSYSYILLQPSSLINTQYGFNLYRKGEFFNEKWIKML